MRWWLTAWQVVRDVGFPALGAYGMYKQINATSPSWVVVVGCLALIFPAVRAHVVTILSGLSEPPGGHGPDLPPAPSSPGSHSASPPESSGGARDPGA